ERRRPRNGRPQARLRAHDHAREGRGCRWPAGSHGSFVQLPRARPVPGAGVNPLQDVPATRDVTTAAILLAEDETLVRQGVKAMIETAADLRVTAEAATGREAVEWCARRAFDLVILDIRMPEMDGVAAAQRILARQPHQKILFLTTFNDDDYALKALRLGVRGYLLKNADAQDLIDSIRSVLAGGLSLEDQVAAKVMPRLLQGQGAVGAEGGNELSGVAAASG